jgi:uncharacterized membrane protein
MTRKQGAHRNTRASVTRSGIAGSRRGSRHEQRGAIALIAGLCIALAVVLVLGTTYLGLEFSQRRQLQNEADLAALAAAQEINADPTCQGVALSTAISSASSNGYAASNPTPVVKCGYWQASATAGGSFSQTIPSGAQANAVSVTLSAPVAYFGLTDTVNAIARNQAEDTFSLTSTLASLNGGIVNALLNGLLSGIFGGQQFNLSLAVGDYQNLAGVSLKLLDIATALSAASVDGVLGTSVTLGQLIQAEITAATQEGVASVNLNVLNTILAQIGLNGGPTLQLGNLLGLSVANGKTAVGAGISALGLLNTALETAYVNANGISIANGSNFLQVPLSITIPSNPLLTANVAAYIQLLQPPTIASGPPGTNAQGQYYTFAQSAVGEVFLTVQLSVLGFGGGSALSINLPIWLFVGQSTAGLAAVNCTAAQRSATINVTPGVLGLYIGGSMSSPPQFNQKTGAATGSASAPIIQVLNLIPGLPPLLSVSIGSANGLSVPLTGATQSVTFSYPLSQSSASWTPNSSANPAYSLTSSTPLITATGDLVNTVLAELSNPANLNITILGLPFPLLSDLISALSPILTGVLNPVFALLDLLVTPLLQLLGLQVGQATVQNFPAAITCSPSLVR